MQNSLDIVYNVFKIYIDESDNIQFYLIKTFKDIDNAKKYCNNYIKINNNSISNIFINTRDKVQKEIYTYNYDNELVNSSDYLVIEKTIVE